MDRIKIPWVKYIPGRHFTIGKGPGIFPCFPRAKRLARFPYPRNLCLSSSSAVHNPSTSRAGLTPNPLANA